VTSKAGDVGTAAAFAESWNRVGEGSVYSESQFLEWFEPLDLAMVKNQDVLELGFGNGSLLVHMGRLQPRRLVGVELGDTVEQTKRNLRDLPAGMVELHRGDLCEVNLGTFDLVYCIGVLHHLEHPEEGFRAVLRHVRPGGRFHCWVYAWEGNTIVRHVVEPIRRLTSRLPWWLTKYGVALPLVIPYFLYAKSIAMLARAGMALSRLPLHDYSLWIAQRPFHFFHHVAFDQLVTPRTRYLRRGEVESWLTDTAVDPASVYMIFRNKNSWKFGGRRTAGVEESAGAFLGRDERR